MTRSATERDTSLQPSGNLLEASDLAAQTRDITRSSLAMVNTLAYRHVDSSNRRGKGLLRRGGVARGDSLTYALHVGADGGPDVSVSQGPLRGLPDSLF